MRGELGKDEQLFKWYSTLARLDGREQSSAMVGGDKGLENTRVVFVESRLEVMT